MEGLIDVQIRGSINRKGTGLKKTLFIFLEIASKIQFIEIDKFSNKENKQINTNELGQIIIFGLPFYISDTHQPDNLTL